MPKGKPKDGHSIYEKRYRRTANGLITRMYSNQLSRGKRYGRRVEYTSTEFREWVLAQPNFMPMYEVYVASGFDRRLVPSIDRIDHKGHYSFSNIQLLTMRDNCAKGIVDEKRGFKPVRQIGPDGAEVGRYESGAEAERATGIKATHITRVAKGKAKTTGGFRWEYA